MAAIVTTSLIGPQQVIDLRYGSLLLPLPSTGWKSARVSMLAAIGDSGIVMPDTSGEFFIGFCSGNTAPYDRSLTTTNAIGVKSDFSASRTAGVKHVATGAFTKRTGTTSTGLGAANIGDYWYIEGGRYGMFSFGVRRVDTIATPGTYTFWALGNGTTPADFSAEMFGALSENLESAASTFGAVVSTPSAVTGAFDETPGALNHVQVYSVLPGAAFHIAALNVTLAPY
jgi:hypothetical protein